MTKTRVLVVGMVDSIHLARWLSQFEDTDFEIRVFPSTYFKHVHSKLRESNFIKLVGFAHKYKYYGYVDYFATISFAGPTISRILRRMLLSVYMGFYKPQIIHAIEIQHAGYLVAKLKHRSRRQILTNWGSDIYYFQHFSSHKKQIVRALKWCTHYSAECDRDYELASNYDFTGQFLPKIPNAGGFDIPTELGIMNWDKRQVIVKCYGGKFGLGDLALEVAAYHLANQAQGTFFFYSVTDDLIPSVRKLVEDYPGRVSYSTLRHPLKYEDLANSFRESVIYLGLSKSDGLSTSFLESLVHGVYPIQTNTSCAMEVVEAGAIASIIKPDFNVVRDTLFETISNIAVVQDAREQNLEVAKSMLERGKVRELAISFYNLQKDI